VKVLTDYLIDTPARNVLCHGTTLVLHAPTVIKKDIQRHVARSPSRRRKVRIVADIEAIIMETLAMEEVALV
jgi:hypothetical protein